ncbi:MAG: M23 family metallopeptidase [Candidatus Peribacteraceae bacterium]|nr:M23 family metallopeptidase [Candidatus Peribacteraceae bacterium]MDD5075013.1 M23 family metallopeptidase [Candidatus Peribacteraceae bacterium]
MGFTLNPILRKKEPHPFHYLAQRTSFWLAVLSVFAFVAGNMIGQHGWQVFWKSVMGQGDDSLIVYTGTVTPVALVPDYAKWSTYGGNAQEHTFREVPQNALIPLPAYAPGREHHPVYSVEYMGSYATGVQGTGSHPAVDIRIPVGTPIRSIANGIVSEVKEGGGFGKTIVIKHPNVPDPANPKLTTTLYSNYSHLSAIYVTEGAIVEKGEQIGLSGRTGDVSGPHLHFQIDRADAPWHPYWPFTTQDITAAGLRTTVQAIDKSLGSDRGYAFTVNPLLYVQAEYSPVTTVVQGQSSSSSAVQSVSWLSRVQTRAERMRAARLARMNSTTVAIASSIASVSSRRSAASNSSVSSTAPVVVTRRDVVVVSRTEIAMNLPTQVASVEIWHDGTYTDRGWERVRLTLLDAQGNVVTSPVLNHDVVLRAAFGSADFRPSTLTSLDFQNGKAEVSVLPFGRRTLIIQVMPFNVLSQPMRYEKQ